MPRRDDMIEKAIVAAGKTAPRVTPADVQAVIVCEHYFTADDGALGSYFNHDDTRQEVLHQPIDHQKVHQRLSLLTFCVLTLSNGFTVTGESACASPENYDEQIGRDIAKQNAMQKIWPLLGYELCTKLAGQTDAS